MKYLVGFLILLFPFGQLLRFDLKGSEVVLHANDLAVAVVVIIWFISKGRKVFSKLKTDTLFLPICFWVLAMATSLLVNIPRLWSIETVISSFYLVRWVAYAGLYFVARDTLDRKTLLRWLALATVAVAGSGLVQYFLAPDTTALAVQEWDNHYFRLIGTFLDPGFTGAILVFGIILIFLTTKDTGDKIGLAAVYTALALTYSRASYLMYLIAFAAVAVFRRSAKIFVLAALVLGLTILVLPRTPGEGTKLSRENSLWARIHNWKETLTIWQDHPLFGVGYNSYRYAQRDYGYLSSETVAKSHAGAGADSSLFLVLATTGLFGFLAYSHLLWRLWSKNTTILFRASFLAIMAHSFFNNTLFYPWVMEWLWLIFALTEST